MFASMFLTLRLSLAIASGPCQVDQINTDGSALVSCAADADGDDDQLAIAPGILPAGIDTGCTVDLATASVVSCRYAAKF